MNFHNYKMRVVWFLTIKIRVTCFSKVFIASRTFLSKLTFVLKFPKCRNLPHSVKKCSKIWRAMLCWQLFQQILTAQLQTKSTRSPYIWVLISSNSFRSFDLNPLYFEICKILCYTLKLICRIRKHFATFILDCVFGRKAQQLHWMGSFEPSEIDEILHTVVQVFSGFSVSLHGGRISKRVFNFSSSF